MFTLILRSEDGTETAVDIGASVAALGVDINHARYIGIRYNGEDVCGVTIPSVEEIVATPAFQDVLEEFKRNAERARNTDHGRLN